MANKYFETKLQEITAMVTIDIPQAIANGITQFEYANTLRRTLNEKVIQAVFGCEFKDGKKEVKVRFKHKLPNMTELGKLINIINTFVERVENPFFMKTRGLIDGTIYTEDDYDNDDDMDIPDESSVMPVDITVTDPTPMPTIGKLSNKNIRDYVAGATGLSRKYLNGNDIIEMAAIAEQIKKKKKKETALIIGGISLLVIGGTVATVAIVNSKKEKASEEDVIDATFEEMDDEIPHVEDAEVI